MGLGEMGLNRLYVCMTVLLQVARIQDIDNKFPVKIIIDTKNEKIQIEGLAENVTSAVDEVHSIFHELEKEERHKLEAEYISKEVITCYMVSIINLFSFSGIHPNLD